MTDAVEQLLRNNQEWAREFARDNPGIFEQLAQQQSPDYLWIGCSDSRVPANTIVGLQPGEVFVHRNVANLVSHADFNLLSVLEFSIQVLEVKDVILCGHYGCGGVSAAVERKQHGVVDNWLHPIKDLYRTHSEELSLLSEKAAMDRLCELNVIEQVKNLSHTSIVQDAWKRGKHLSIHGVVYGIDNGLLKNLHCTVNSLEQVEDLYRLD